MSSGEELFTQILGSEACMDEELSRLGVPVTRRVPRSLIPGCSPFNHFILHSQCTVSTGDFYSRAARLPETEAAVSQLDPVKPQTFPKV